MVQSILVPLDGSPFGEQALPYALTLAGKAGAAVQLVHVHVPMAALYSGNEIISDVMLDSTLREQRQTYLDGVVRRVQEAVRVPVTSALLDGPVVEVLVEHAAAVKADLVVMTTHGRGPVVRFWLGSVADRLVRRLAAPVLLVRPKETPLELAKPVSVGRILVPLDGSELAEKILEPAMEFGVVPAEFVLLRVVEPFYVPDYPAEGNVLAGTPPSFVSSHRGRPRAYLHGVAERFHARSLRVQPRLVLERPAAETILAEAETHKCSLIAPESHGRGGLSRMFLGSVADKIIRGASVAVLVHHPK